MTFQRNDRPLFTEIFGPLLGLKEEWETQGATPAELFEMHEPTVFLGAVRPETETRIIPSTWRENGFGIFGDVGGFAYRTYVVNGLDAGGFSSALPYQPRASHTEGSSGSMLAAPKS